VTPRSVMPQGTISRKKSRSVATLNANPWLVTSADPDADGANLLGDDPSAGQPFDPPGLETVLGRHPDHDLFEIPHVPMNVTAIGPQIDDRVPHDLTGAVVGHVAAPSGFVGLDAQFGQALRRGEDVRPALAGFHPEGQHVRVLEKQQRVVDFVRRPLRHERLLKLEALA